MCITKTTMKSSKIVESAVMSRIMCWPRNRHFKNDSIFLPNVKFRKYTIKVVFENIHMNWSLEMTLFSGLVTFTVCVWINNFSLQLVCDNECDVSSVFESLLGAI